MTRQVLKAIFADNATVTLKEPHVENKELDRSLSARTAATIPPERRCEARAPYRCSCSIEVAESIDEELVFIEQGEAVALNRSAEGMLLIMGRALHVTQLFEVHVFHSRWDRTANVYEARWTRPIQVESLGNLYLVGCKRIGPCHYLSF
jgi:hypothetical protein